MKEGGERGSGAITVALSKVLSAQVEKCKGEFEKGEEEKAQAA